MRAIVSQLVESGKVEHAYLGVQIVAIPSDVASQLGVPEGVEVTRVVSGTPADDAGLRAATGQKTVDGQSYPTGGDVISAFDGQGRHVRRPSCRRAVDSKRPGDKVDDHLRPRRARPRPRRSRSPRDRPNRPAPARRGLDAARIESRRGGAAGRASGSRRSSRSRSSAARSSGVRSGGRSTSARSGSTPTWRRTRATTSSRSTPRSRSATRRSTSCSPGRATFTLDDETLDAPAGTVVFVRDPKVKRHARATEPDTAVLAVGGPRGRRIRAVSVGGLLRRRAAPGRRRLRDYRAELDDALERRPDHSGDALQPRVRRGARGRSDDALAHVPRALELKPEWAEMAQKDEDLASLRELPGWPISPSDRSRDASLPPLLGCAVAS